MIVRRASEQRGHANHGWLDTYHSFSFANYHDAAHMGFRKLRVLNDDTVEPGQGFDSHSHRDMEVVSYVVEGSLAHEDSMGTGSILRPGDVQRMSAGRGVTHSEFNASQEDRVRFFQIWVHPEEQGLAPEYQEGHFGDDTKRGVLKLIVSRDGRKGSLRIHQDVDFYATLLEGGETVQHPIAPGRHAWLQLTKGRIAVGEVELSRGDGAAVSDESEILIEGRESAEVLVLDLA
jgi:redox-sensitive bicupin YhaK (pirin superfamily)